MDNDLISRSRLRMNFIQAVEDENPELYGEIILDLIDNAPTVEQPQGEWKLIQGSSVVHSCSCCNARIIAMIPYDFCPNCGAKMKQD